MVQRFDLALNAAAAREIDHRISHGTENFAGADHIRSAKKYDTVAVGVSRRLGKNLYGLTIEGEVLETLEGHGGKTLFRDVQFRRAEAREGIVLRVYIDFGG